MKRHGTVLCALMIMNLVSSAWAMEFDTQYNPHLIAQKSLRERCANHPNLLGIELANVIEEKQTNLAVSADLTKTQEILDFADQVGPYICMLKVHADIIKNFSVEFAQQLRKLAAKHNFLIMEDRKFADIGNTVKQQYTGGLHNIDQWADFVTVHAIAGPGILNAMQSAKTEKSLPRRGAVVIAHMSTKDNLADDEYTKKAIKNVQKHPDFVVGFVTQKPLKAAPSYIRFMPGISLIEHSINDQRFITPQKAVKDGHADVIIVGRSIYTDSDPVAATMQYKDAGWIAYQERISQQK